METTYRQSYCEKTKTGYLYYCHLCGKKTRLSKKKYKQVKYSSMCPTCYCTSTIHKKPFPKRFFAHELFAWTDETGQPFGYYCQMSDHHFYCTQVAYWEGKSFYARYVQKCMGWGISFNPEEKPNFTKRHSSYYSYNSLENSFMYIMQGNEQIRGMKCKPKTYREFLEENVNPIDYKSNQLYLIKNNVFNIRQIEAIRYFDLKNVEDVYKYNSYIKNCSYGHKARILNVHYLDYLSKNHIPYSDFMDYAADLETLGYKLDKPKDFYDRHEKAGELIKIKNDEKYRKGIEKNFRKLKKKKLDAKDYSIKPIESLEEINYVAKSLHNCMARMYTKPYSRGETDLYCLWKDEKPFIAIEVLNGKLEQVRADHNNVPEKKYKAIVTRWYRGAYAN